MGVKDEYQYRHLPGPLPKGQWWVATSKSREARTQADSWFEARRKLAVMLGIDDIQRVMPTPCGEPVSAYPEEL